MKILKHNLAIHDTYHLTVLKQEAVDALAVQPGKLYLDATFGGGGHTRAILDADPTCRVIALDWDIEAIERNAPALQETYGDRLIVERGNFAHSYRLLQKHGITRIDGVLADFGTSQFQIMHEDGFSFSVDTPLDMRMSKGHHYFSAEYIVNKFSQKQLADIIYTFGEDLGARKIAAAIVAARAHTPLTTTKQLADLIAKTMPPHGRQRIHPATRTFQALRIFVNKELENIELFLKNVTPLINPGGRLACISFHSLEDRIVKLFLRDQAHLFKTITKKPVIASDEECTRNRSARSAKLRIGEKLS